MAFTYAALIARTTSTSNPTTASLTLGAEDRVVCLLIKTVGATDRTGGAPTWGERTFTQADSTQKASASPECSAELWYLLNPPAGTATLTIPNTGAVSLRYTVVAGQLPAGHLATALGVNGGNATSTNPTPGAIVVPEPAILFGIVASGAQTWGPSAQAGTVIANTDDGANGGGEQYLIQATPASVTLNWTFGTSDDWGAVAAAFGESPALALLNYLAPRVGSGMSTIERIR